MIEFCLFSISFPEFNFHHHRHHHHHHSHCHHQHYYLFVHTHLKEPTWLQLCSTWAQHGCNLPQLGPTWLNVSATWTLRPPTSSKNPCSPAQDFLKTLPKPLSFSQDLSRFHQDVCSNAFTLQVFKLLLDVQNCRNNNVWNCIVCCKTILHETLHYAALSVNNAHKMYVHHYDWVHDCTSAEND